MQDQSGKLSNDLRILLIEDEEPQLEITKLNLESLDSSIKIISVSKPSDALILLQGQSFDCIVSDYQMPGMNGIQLCCEIRKTSTTPFIIYTGRGSEEVASAAFAAGADDYVRKEQDLSHYQVLARRIRNAVERHQSAELYRVGIERNREGVAIIRGTDFVYANQAMANMLGIDNPAELIGQNIMRWVAHWDRDSVERRTLNRQRGGDEPGVFYYSIRRADGEVRLMHASASVISYRGSPASIVFNHDDTEQRDMERAFQESEERFRLALKSAPVSLAAQDRDLRFVWAYNQRTIDPYEVIGKRDEDIFTPKDAAYLVALKRGVIESGKEVNDETWLTVNGKRVYLELIIVPTMNDAGEVTGVEIATVDITERKIADDETRRLLAAVQQERDRLSALVNSIQDEVWFADSDKKFTLVNTSALKEFGFTSTESGINVEKLAMSLEVYRPDGSPRPVEEAPPLRALRGEVIQNQEEIVKMAGSGKMRYREVNAAPVRDADGTIIGAVSVVRDVTERKLRVDELKVSYERLRKSEEALAASNEELQASEEKLKTLNVELSNFSSNLEGIVSEKTKDIEVIKGRLEAFINSALDPMLIFDKDLRLIDINRVGLELFPKYTTISDIIGKLMTELSPGIDDTDRFVGFRRVLETGQPYFVESYQNDPKFGGRWMSLWAFKVGDGLGIINRDITERKEAEERLQEAYHYTRSLIEASLDPLVTINRDGRITDVNEATVQATGVPSRELIGSDFSDYFTDPEKARAGYRKVFEEGQVRDYPLTIRHRTGKRTDVLYNATIYRNPMGSVIGVFAAARDVMEKNQLVEQLKRAEVIGAVEQMGATVAHDLRGPLGLIVQSVNMTKQNPSLTPRMLKLIEENAVRSLKMIADWRSSTREVLPQPVNTNLGGLIKNVLEGSTIPVNVDVNTLVGEGLDSVNVDPDIMHRVIDNLVKNAVEAMPNGGKLSVNAERDDNHLIIRIGDTGAGIPEELRGHIFSPLFTTKSGGMGLGLTYCRRAVEAQGGSIGFESEVGKGTTFTIRLPIQ
jgi:PAS domain S-box-containing protein